MNIVITIVIVITSFTISEGETILPYWAKKILQIVENLQNSKSSLSSIR